MCMAEHVDAERRDNNNKTMMDDVRWFNVHLKPLPSTQLPKLKQIKVIIALDVNK